MRREPCRRNSVRACQPIRVCWVTAGGLRRVVQCIAHQLFLASPVKVSVAAAALLHHSPVEDLPPVAGEEGLVPKLLRTFHNPAGAPEHLRLLAEIIHVANRFDEL